MSRFKLFRTSWMLMPPRWGTHFRVGQYVGPCVLRLPGVAVMRVIK